MNNSYTDLSNNDYLYTGKEQQRSFDINLYDSQARFQSLTGTFLSIDPMAEKYYNTTPYAYCANNPVIFVDPEGRDWYMSKMTGWYTWFECSHEIVGYDYIGGKGSVLGESEDRINEFISYLQDEAKRKEEKCYLKNIYTQGFTFSIRGNSETALSSKYSPLGLFGEFLYNSGPEYSVFLDNHPYVSELQSDATVIECQNRIFPSKSGYYYGSKKFGFIDVITNIFSMAKQFIGSFSYYGKRTSENTIMNVIFDSKSKYSFLYHGLVDLDRKETPHMGNTYQFYIWTTTR